MDRSLLIVEDDGPLAAMLSEVLRTEGFRITHARDGLHALQFITGGLAPDLILMDMHLPGYSGWDLGMEFKQLGLQTPIVVMTADADPKRCAAEVGARAFLPKPLDLTMLLQTIERLLRAEEP